MINPRNYDSYIDYLNACEQNEKDNGVDAERARFNREMMQYGNGEEYEGQYGGKNEQRNIKIRK